MLDRTHLETVEEGQVNVAVAGLLGFIESPEDQIRRQPDGMGRVGAQASAFVVDTLRKGFMG